MAETSNNEPVVQFENVSKQFDFTEDKPRSVLETVVATFSPNRIVPPKDEFDGHLWALKDVSFSVMPGQGFGIIGRNGSGKSTALKMVARIIPPTSGRIVVRGRVSALLELGAGFHLDLTGRENIFLNGSVLGLQEDEIHSLYQQIVDFSELESYINMPVKHYSSGMFMRLGFSVAIHVQPDVLIVDEILAVGDQAFQAKCLDRILELKRQGTTIMMVSHNINQLRSICSELVWIEKGHVKAQGPTEAVVAEYNAFSYDREVTQTRLTEQSFERQGDQRVEITAVRLLDDTGEEQSHFQTGDALTIEMAYHAHVPVPNPEFGLAIFRQDGLHINGPNTVQAGLDLGVVEGEGVVRYRIEALPLLPARYNVTTAVHDSRYPHCYDLHKEAYSFRIVPGGTTEQNGVIQLPSFWEASTKGEKI